jgi:hypothetical protein
MLHRDDLFQQFALEYAANEDRIRKLYEELEQETQQFHVLTLTISTSPTDLRWYVGTLGREVRRNAQARQVA